MNFKVREIGGQASLNAKSAARRLSSLSYKTGIQYLIPWAVKQLR